RSRWPTPPTSARCSRVCAGSKGSSTPSASEPPPGLQGRKTLLSRLEHEALLVQALLGFSDLLLVPGFLGCCQGRFQLRDGDPVGVHKSLGAVSDLRVAPAPGGRFR